MILVEKIMTPNPITILMETSIRQIGGLFRRFGFHHLLVLADNKELIGIVSDRDYLKVMSPFLDTYSERDRDKDILNRHAHTIMSHNPKAAKKDMTLLQANHFFVENKVSCLPIVDDNNHVLGIVTWRDILKWNEKILALAENRSDCCLSEQP
ncbi:MAG: hypothetical protein ACD_73C00121G0002 [uncultured bacterium]|nr:MAG: hypothetical protein ACD_73C00121G0002 [uncultured bacterium]